MRRTKNTTYVEGYIYEHKLEARVTGENSKNPGTPFIMGNLDIATDNAITNIVTVHFTYVTPVTSKGNPNATYEVLKGIIDGKYKTVMGSGKEVASKVRIDSAIGLNEFYSDRNGTSELVSVKRNEGGFVHITDSLKENENERNTFTADIVITNVSRVEENPERNITEHSIVRGCVFDFRNSILPVEFVVRHPGAMNYFESLEATSSHPVFTQVSGVQVSQTVTRSVETTTPWGETVVKTIPSSRREWVITDALQEPYDFGNDSEDLTPAELVKMMGQRETDLATIKSRQDEYRASRAAAPAPTAAPAKASSQGFNF